MTDVHAKVMREKARRLKEQIRGATTQVQNLALTLQQAQEKLAGFEAELEEIEGYATGKGLDLDPKEEVEEPSV